LRLNELGGVERAALLADTPSNQLRVAVRTRAAPISLIDAIMRGQARSHGPGEHDALEEYKESAERHTFLDAQRKDLISSIENTTATFARLTKFRARSPGSFQQKSTKTSRPLSKSCSAAANAFMKLTDEENSAESVST